MSHACSYANELIVYADTYGADVDLLKQTFTSVILRSRVKITI